MRLITMEENEELQRQDKSKQGIKKTTEADKHGRDRTCRGALTPATTLEAEITLF